MPITADYMALVGLMSCLYALGRLLHYFSLVIQDSSNSKSFLSVILSVIAIALFALSFPVSIVFAILDNLHTNRLTNIIQKEEAQKYAAQIDALSSPKKTETPSIHFVKPNSLLFQDLYHRVVSDVSSFTYRHSLAVKRDMFPCLCLTVIYCIAVIRRNSFLSHNAYRHFIKNYSSQLSIIRASSDEIQEIEQECLLFWEALARFDPDPTSGIHVRNIAHYALQQISPDIDISSSIVFLFAKTIISTEHDFSERLEGSYIPIE